MNPEQKLELRSRLAELTARDRKTISKEAAERRSHVQKVKDDPRARWDVETWTLHLLQSRDPEARRTATVIHITRERCRVRYEGKDYDCLLSRDVGQRQQTALAPGDEVVIEPYGELHRVTEVRPRRTSLTRTDPINPNRQRTIVANVDVVVIVVSVVAPPLHPRLVDRYLAAVHRGGASAVVVVNKVDLHPDAESLGRDLVQLAHFPEIGVPVYPVSTTTGQGLEAVREAIRGKTVSFVGHSGVGKSSLLSALAPTSGAVAGAVSEASGRGRHTTTSSVLVEADGLRVIDTPGIREFALDFRTPEQVRDAFPDLQVGRCRFGDCLHRDEPDCAVREAVREGKVSRARYVVYRRLLADLVGGGSDEPPDGEGSFPCIACGATVSLHGGGTEHRNHCPRCLCSKHLDDTPGDRAAGCGGMMEPIAVWVRKGGEWAIVHRCRSCGHLASNRIAADDNEALLLSLAVRPLSQPPFPLDRVGAI